MGNDCDLGGTGLVKRACLLSFLFWIALIGISGLALFIDGWGYGTILLVIVLVACSSAILYWAGYDTGYGER